MKFEQLYEFRQLAYQCLGSTNAYSFALVAYGQHLHLIVVEDDRKFREISLSLITLKAGGNPNKHSLSLEPKLGRIRLRKWDNLHFRGSPKHPITLILVERLEAITGQLKTQPL